MAAPGKCHKEKAPEGGSPLSKVLFPHCLRTFSCPNVFPQVTGLCLNPDSPTAPHRWAETHCAWGHRGTADFRGMWMLRWSLVTLWWLPVLLPVHLAACCCIQCPVASSQWAHAPSPAAPGYSGHQLLALSLVPRQTILSQRGNPLSSYPAPVCQGTPSRAGQVHMTTTASLSRLDEQTETLPPHGVHLQPGASSCLQLVATVGEFLYINRAPNLNRYFFLFLFSVQQVSKVIEKPKEWPSPGPAQLCHPGGSFARVL